MDETIPKLSKDIAIRKDWRSTGMAETMAVMFSRYKKRLACNWDGSGCHGAMKGCDVNRAKEFCAQIRSGQSCALA